MICIAFTTRRKEPGLRLNPRFCFKGTEEQETPEKQNFQRLPRVFLKRKWKCACSTESLCRDLKFWEPRKSSRRALKFQNDSRDRREDFWDAICSGKRNSTTVRIWKDTRCAKESNKVPNRKSVAPYGSRWLYNVPPKISRTHPHFEFSKPLLFTICNVYRLKSLIASP